MKRDLSLPEGTTKQSVVDIHIFRSNKNFALVRKISPALHYIFFFCHRIFPPKKKKDAVSIGAKSSRDISNQAFFISQPIKPSKFISHTKPQRFPKPLRFQKNPYF